LKFRRQALAEVNVNLTPLIDIVFLLLIFFMVSTTFTRETQLTIDLPDAVGEPAAEREAPVEILIDEQGRYRVNGRPLVDQRIATLQAAIYGETDGDSSRALVITADAQSPHQAVVRAMDAAGQMGFTRLTISTREPGPSP
jgi:biopolymer transport protein ExbD